MHFIGIQITICIFAHDIANITRLTCKASPRRCSPKSAKILLSARNNSKTLKLLSYFYIRHSFLCFDEGWINYQRGEAEPNF